MKLQRATLIVLVVSVVAGLAFTPFVGGVAPAVDSASAQTLPATYFGEIQTDDGSAPGQQLEVTPIAVADDGTTARLDDETIIADADGTFGGPTASDDKIEVQAEGAFDDPDKSTEDVRFEVSGAVRTIKNVTDDSGTTTVNDTTIPFDNTNGDQEVVLEVDEQTLDGNPDYSVSITDIESPVIAGDQVNLTAKIENNGDAPGTQDINFSVSGEGQIDQQSVSLGVDQNESVAFDFQTDIDDQGDRDFTVTSLNDSDTATVSIEQAVATPTFDDQATVSTRLTGGTTAAGALVELGTDTNINGTVLVTYDNSGDSIVAGTATFNSSDQQVLVSLDNTSGFPGTHTARTVRDGDLSGGYAAGDVLSDDTDSATVGTDSAAVLEATLSFADQSYNDSTAELTVETADLIDGEANDTLFQVDVQPTDSAGNLIENEYVGSSEVLAGENSDVAVDLRDSAGNDVSINETDDYVATMHLVDDSTVQVGDDSLPDTFPELQNTDATIGFVDDGVADNATVTVFDSPFFEVSNLDPDGATFGQNANFNVTADVENLGDFEDVQNVTLEIENSTDDVVIEETEVDLTLADGATQTVTFENINFSDVDINGTETFSHTVASDNTSVSGTLTIVEAPNADVTFADQATNSSTVNSLDRSDAGVVVENVSSNVDAAVLVTYEDGGDDVVAGIKTFAANELDGADVTIKLEDGDGLPGNHTARVVPETAIASDFGVGDSVSADIAEEILDNNTASVFESTVVLDDADEVGSVDKVELSQADLLDGAANDTEFVVVVRSFDGGTVGDAIGSTSDLSGSNDDVTVSLDENITDRGNNDIIAVVQATASSDDFGEQIPHASADEFINSGAADNATATVREPAEFDVGNLDPAQPTVVQDATFNISALIENIGDVKATENITLTIENETDDVVVNRTQELTLGGEPVGDVGENQTATFEDVNLSEPGNYTHVVESANDTANGTIEVVDEITTDVEVNDQATSSSTITSTDETDAGIVVENVSANVDVTLLVTYESGGSEVIAGSGEFLAGDLSNDTTIVAIEDQGGFPGNHSVQVVPTTELSTAYGPGDSLSTETANAVDSQANATISESTVTLDDQDVVETAGNNDLDVSASVESGTSSDTKYVVNLHETDSSGSPATFVGTTEVVTGSVDGEELLLQDSNGDNVTINETDEFVAMVHIVDNESVNEGDRLPPGTFPMLANADSTDGFVASGVADNGTVTILDPAESTLSNLDIAGQGTNAAIVETTDKNVSVELQNIGDVEGEFNANLTIGDNVVNATTSPTVGGNSSTTVVFEDVTSTLSLGEYDVTVSTADENISGQLSVTEATDIELTTLAIGGQGSAAEIDEGDDEDISVNVENVGANASTVSVDLAIENGETVTETQSISVDLDVTQTVTFETVTGDLGSGDYTVTVTADDDSLTGSLSVAAESDGLGLGGPTGGSGGGGAAPDDDEDVVGDEPVESVERAITDDEPDQPGTVLIFDATNIETITFDNEDIEGDITVEQFDDITPGAPPLPGDFEAALSTVITVSEAASGEPATVEAFVSTERLEEQNLDPDEIAVFRLPTGGDEWERLDTDVEAVDGGFQVTFRTPGFSEFAIASTPDEETPTPTPETPTPEPPDDDTPTDTPTETPEEPDEGISPVVVIVIALVLLVVVGVAAYALSQNDNG